MNLPVLPEVGQPISAEQIATIEHNVSERLATISSINVLAEYLAQARALEAYLAAKGLQGPMLGAQRRIEGRIGQLLGDPTPGARTDLQPCPNGGEVIERHDREDFRLLARALDAERDTDDPEEDVLWWLANRDIPNGDGTHFRAYPITLFPPSLLIGDSIRHRQWIQGLSTPKPAQRSPWVPIGPFMQQQKKLW